jgi:hypothetical protein
MQIPAARAQAVVGMRDGARVWHSIEACIGTQASVLLPRSVRADARQLVVCASLEIALRGDPAERIKVLNMLGRCRMVDALIMLLRTGVVSPANIAKSMVVTEAGRSGYLDVLRALWKSGVRKEHMLGNGERCNFGALVGACTGGHLEVVRALFRSVKEGGFGFCLRDAKAHKCLALGAAAGSGNAELVRFLIADQKNGGVGMQKRHATQSKAMESACRRCHVPVIRLLVSPESAGGLGFRPDANHVQHACLPSRGRLGRRTEASNFTDTLKLFRRPFCEGGLGISKEEAANVKCGAQILRRCEREIAAPLRFLFRAWELGGMGVEPREVRNTFRFACKHGMIDTPEVIDVFREYMDVIDVLVRHAVLRSAAAEGEVAILRVSRELGFTTTDVGAVRDEMLLLAQRNEHPNIVRFLNLPWSEGGMLIQDVQDVQDVQDDVDDVDGWHDL